MRLAWLALVLLSVAPAKAQIASVTLQGPERDFGHFVGDLLTSTAIITVAPGMVLDTRSLPPEGPASPIADVRQVKVGGTAGRIEIRVTYQSFFAPDQVTQAEIPGYTLVFSAHGVRMTEAVPGFGFTASPFRHDLQPTLDPAVLRRDHAAMPAQAPNAAWMVAAGLALIAAGLAALVRPWPVASRRQPFAAAAAAFSGAARKRAPQGDPGRDILRALHQAFDATAGRHVFADDIDDFLEHHPCLSPLRGRIESFFACSRLVFFGGTSTPADAAPWVKLCRDLARAERRG